MHNDPIHPRDEQPPHARGIATTRQRSRTHRRGPVRRSHPNPRRWALVQVWNGAVLATFADEASAREAIATADDNEVVVLSLPQVT